MDPDQTVRMRRLVWIHAGRKRIMLVLSWRGSYTSNCLLFFLMVAQVRLLSQGLVPVAEHQYLFDPPYNPQIIYNRYQKDNRIIIHMYMFTTECPKFEAKQVTCGMSPSCHSIKMIR
jgi:hypothetical protein